MEQNKHIGDLIVRPGIVYDCENVTGYIDASGADTKTAFPKLTTVGGSIYARGADTKTAFPKLTTVGGSIDARGADTKTAFPKLTTVGGSIDARGAEHVRKNNPEAARISRAALEASFANNNYVLTDNMLAAVVRKKRGLLIVRICGQTKNSYIVRDGNRHAHGNTLAEARASLRFKIGDRDKTAYVKWTNSTKATLAEMIVAYRVITGACENGVRHFLSTRAAPELLTVLQAIEITKGAYGGEVFSAFFKENRK